MPTLKNPRQELFAQEIVKGKSMTQAYLDAGYLANGHSAEVCASRMLSKVEIAARVRELQERAAVRVELSRADILKMLIEDRLDARGAQQYSVAVAADKLLGSELHRMFTDRQVVEMTDLSNADDAQIRQFIEAMGLDPDKVIAMLTDTAISDADASLPKPTVPGSGSAN